ncbi:MAG: hypothetical protein DSM107014_07920 [Gomphosphaeria aponina SAG 52.96 = DSM 107014]|uniref:Uncharacterized protein n=1 Tax=Gomphosphaeria aponina SAG 52.96 = DSM 107014 TaxID=1521640 RepID=A0A941JT22_9CHRO|nr:hypothetical protein [Gomphosphaeria aponina SAG 52.96 = DSM 107014]
MLTEIEAEKLALEFLVHDWEIPNDDQEWFEVKTSRLLSEGWYIVELEVPGYPDKWVIQVYDTGECDPCYSFVSPLSSSATTDDLEDLPKSIAEMIATERSSQNNSPGV